MRAGALRHSITIERQVSTRDKFGAPSSEWEVFATTYAAIEDLTGREALEAQQVKSRITSRITMRYLDGITPSMRINHNGQLYNILWVADPEGRKRVLHLHAERA